MTHWPYQGWSGWYWRWNTQHCGKESKTAKNQAINSIRLIRDDELRTEKGFKMAKNLQKIGNFWNWPFQCDVNNFKGIGQFPILGIYLTFPIQLMHIEWILEPDGIRSKASSAIFALELSSKDKRANLELETKLFTMQLLSFNFDQIWYNFWTYNTSKGAVLRTGDFAFFFIKPTLY